MLRLRLVGELVAEVDGDRVDLPTGWRARSLLAWLALHPRSHLRSDVAARFWPEILDASARASLRNALWALRRSLGPGGRDALLATRDRVGLERESGLWVDVDELGRLEGEGRLEEAVDLCHDDLLVDLDDDWVLEARDEFRDRVAKMLERLAARAEEQGERGRAVELTRRGASLDRLSEEPQRQLMRRLAEAGDAASALAAYSRFRERLRQEVGISPSQETRRLAESLRASRSVSSQDPPASGPTAPSREDRAVTVDAAARWRPGMSFPLPPRLLAGRQPGLVGREAELSELRRELDRVTARSGPRMVVIAGEAGVGKSRLAAELALSAAREGAIVLAGVAHDEAIGLQQPIAEALAHYRTAAAPDERERRLAPRAAALEPLLPAGHDRTPPRRDTRLSAGRRYALLEATSSLLAELAQTAPVVVVLEDLHWADALTAAMIDHLLETGQRESLLLLGTVRTEELDPSGPVAACLSRLEHRGRMRRLQLAGLSEAETASLAATVSGRQVTHGQARSLHSETSGNPLFIVEFVRSLAGSGRPDGAVRVADVPQGIRDAVVRRLAQLSEPCVRLLRVASVVGREFDLSLLEQVSDLAGDLLEEALDEASLAGVIREGAGESDWFSFSHALVHRTIRDQLTRAHRRRIHARVAAALEARGKVEPELPRLAHHLLQAGRSGDAARAVEVADRAAEGSIERLAYAEAVELLSGALSLVPEGDPRRRKLALRRALAFQGLTHELLTDAPRPVASARGR